MIIKNIKSSSPYHNIQSSTNRVASDVMMNFIGVIAEKLPDAEFTVRITHFPDMVTKVPVDNVFVRAKPLGKIRNKFKIKFAVHDYILVGISAEMAEAKLKTGVVVYRMKEAPL